MVEISDEHFGAFLKYERGIRSYIGMHSEKRSWQPDVVVFWGATGTGKTRKVYEESPNVYSHAGGMWFDGYIGQDEVLFDEFTGSSFQLPYLLKLLDRYPMQVPVKGGFVNWKPRKIYLTSNMDPRSWYANALEEHQAALRRRITSILHFDNFP